MRRVKNCFQQSPKVYVMRWERRAAEKAILPLVIATENGAEWCVLKKRVYQQTIHTTYTWPWKRGSHVEGKENTRAKSQWRQYWKKSLQIQRVTIPHNLTVSIAKSGDFLKAQLVKSQDLCVHLIQHSPSSSWRLLAPILRNVTHRFPKGLEISCKKQNTHVSTVVKLILSQPQGFSRLII